MCLFMPTLCVTVDCSLAGGAALVGLGRNAASSGSCRQIEASESDARGREGGRWGVGGLMLHQHGEQSRSGCSGSASGGGSKTKDGPITRQRAGPSLPL